MSIIHDDNSAIRLPDIDQSQKQRIYDFLQGAVHCWCKNRKNEDFYCRDLVGGDNNDWNDTPLLAIYEYRCNQGSDDPKDSAGKDAGWFLKQVLRNDSRKFQSADGGHAKCYKWIDS